jgi:hypothetical protein
MSDDTSLRGPQDAARISLEEDYEVRYWTEKWGITREQLEEAVQQVGHSASAVAIYLQKPE